MRKSLSAMTLAASLLVAGQQSSLAQPNAPTANYPTRTIRMIVPFAPGGSLDIFARLFAAELSERLGKPVIVENKPGASGNIGTQEVVRATPDGHVILYTSASITINRSLFANPGYDVLKDLVTIGTVAAMPHILVVHPSVSATSVKDLVAELRVKPGKFNYSSPGSGTSAHLTAELFKQATKTFVVHVPYRGGATATAAIVAGEVQMGLVAAFPVLPQVKAGRVRALAVSSAVRSDVAPELPTLKELGLDVVSYQWHAPFVSAQTPKEIVETLHRELMTWLAKPATRARALVDGSDLAPRTLAESQRYVADETKRWAEVVKFSGAKVD